MPAPSRPPIPRPALWIAVPTFVVCLAVMAAAHAGMAAALVIGGLGAVAIGIFAERRFARIISSFDRIERGDRYTMLPTLFGDRAIQHFAGTAETVRAALIEADTLTVDQLRRETEARLHHAGRLFFTGNFRHAVEEVVNAFTSAGERIRGTAADLVQSNRTMANQVTAASEAAAQAAADVAGVASAARDVEALVMSSARQFTGDPLATTNDPMEAQAGSASSSGPGAFRLPARPTLRPCARRWPAARFARRRASTSWSMLRTSICTSRRSSAAWTRRT